MKCCVSCCIVSGKRFVHFPIKNEQLFEKWIENINDPLLFKNKDYQTIYKTHLVCTKHFEKRMLQDKPKRSRVLKNAYPTLFLRKEYPYHIVPVSKDEIDGQYVNPVYEDPLDLLSVDKSAANRDTYKNDVRVKFGCLSLSPIKTSGKKKTKNTITSSTGKINQSAIVSSTVPNLDIEVKPVASIVLKQISPTITSKQMENGYPSPEDLNKSKDNNPGRRSLRSRKMKEDELTVNKSDQEQLTEMSKAVDEIKMDDTVHRINLKKFIKEVDNPPITTSDPQTSSYQGIKSNFSPLRQISPVRQGSRRKFISEKSPTKSPVVKNNSPKNKETVSIETISLIAAIKPCWVVLEKLTDITISALLNNVKTEQTVTEDSPPRTRSRLQKLIEIDTEKRDCDPKLNTSSHKKLNPAKVDSSGSENKHPVCTRNLRSRKLTESSSTLSTSVNTEENGPEPVRSSSAEFKLLIINKQRNYIENIESPKKKDDGNSQDIDYETDAFVKEELQITEQYLDQNDMKTSFDQLEINIEESDPDQSTDIVEELTSSSNIDEPETEMTQVIKSPTRIESEDQSRNICENILTVQLNKELITPYNSPKVSKENLSIDENSAETPSPKHLKSRIDSSKSKEEILSSENTITVQLNKELITSNNSPKVSKEKLSIDENLKETQSPKLLESRIDSSKSKEKILSSENILTVQLNKELITPNNSPKVSQEQLSIEENSEEMSIEEKSEEIQSPIDDLQSCINSSKSKEILSTKENEEIVKDIQSQPSEKILTVQLNKELITPDNSSNVSKENLPIEENSEAMSIEEINSSKSKEILSTEENNEIVKDIQSKPSETILTVQLNEELITPDNSSNVSKEKLSIEENAEEIQSPKRLKSEINSSVSKATEGKLEIVKHIQSKSSVEENTEITSSSEITEEILTVKENHTEIVKDIRITKLKQSTRTLMTSISPEANEPILRVEENKEIMELSRRLELKIYPSKTNEDILSVEKTEKDINHSEPQLISSKPTELLPLDETEHEIIKSPEHSEPNLHSLSASDETENIEKSSTHLKPKYLSPKTSDKFSSNEEMELVIKNTQIIPILKSSEHILSNKTTNDSHKKSVKSREVKSPSKTFQKVMSVEVIVKDKDIKTPKYLNSKHLPPKTSEPTVNLEDKIRKSWKRLAYNLNKPQAKKQKIVNPNDSTLQTSIVPNQISIEYDSFPISNDDATESTSSISSGDTYDVGFSPVQSTPPSSVTSFIDEYSSPLTPDTLKNLDSENDTFNRTVPTDTIIIEDDYDELIATVNKSMNVLEPIIIESHLEDHSTYCKTVSPVSEICAEISLPKKSVTPSKSPNKIKILDNIVIHAAQSQQTTASEQPSTSYSELYDNKVNEASIDAEQQLISQMKPYYKFADGTNYQLELISYIKKPPVSKLVSRVCAGNKVDVSELTTESAQKSIPFEETIDLSSDNEEVIDIPPSASSTMNGKKRKLNHHYRANNKRFREEVPKIITQIKNATSKSLCWKKINDSYHRIFEMSRHDSDFSWLANLVGPTDYRTLDFIWSCKDDKRTEFSLVEKSQACALMHRTGKLYDYLVKYYNLPSRKMLMQFLNKIHIQPGINDGRNEQFIQLNNRGVNKNNYCVLSFDEIKINSRFTYDEEEDSIIGFQHSNENENSIFLSRVLVFMLRGVSEFRRWQQPYAFMFLTNQTKPAKVVQYIKDVIKSALSANFDIIATVCKPKQLFCDSYEILRKETNEYCRTYKFKYDEKVIIVNGKDIVPLYDTLDLIRIFRNRFIKKNISFQMNYQPFEANWNDIIDFYQYDTNQSEIRSKLEDSFVLPDKIRKFDRKTIPNIFEHSVYTGMLLLLTEASPGLHKLKQSARGTAYLIKMFSKLLDSFSLAGNNEILNKQVLSKRFNTWHDTEQTLKSFKFSDKSKNITYKDGSIKKLLDNIKNIDYLCKSLQHRCTIDLRITNFDALEDLLNFVQIKKTPTPYQFISAFKSYCINPCSTDVLLTNLDHYLINPPPVIAVEKIQIAPEKIINSTLKRSKQSDMYIKKITARYLIKLTSNCKNCHAKLLRSETSGICSWKVILKSDLFTVIFNQLLKITSRLVPLEYNRAKIKTIIASYIDKYIDISNIFCPRHDLSKKFINVVVKLYLKFWCRSINEILTGESTMRKSKMDLVQSVASLYYTQNNE